MYETLAVLQRWLWEKKHLRTVEFWITVTVDIAVHITKKTSIIWYCLWLDMQTTATHPSTGHSQASCLPSMFVYLWNGTTLPWGKKNNRLAIRVVCFPTYLICPRHSHCDILFPIDEPYVIRNPHFPTSHTALHIQLAISGENCETGLGRGSKKINK